MKTRGKYLLTRRSLLVGTGLLLFAAGAFRFRGGTVDRAGLVATIIRRKADYVAISESDLHRFSEDYVKQPDWRIDHLLRSRRLNLFYSSTGLLRKTVFAEDREQIEMLERLVVTDFLLATDYFSGETGPGRTLRYQGLQKGPCSNPFAIFT